MLQRYQSYTETVKYQTVEVKNGKIKIYIKLCKFM